MVRGLLGNRLIAGIVIRRISLRFDSKIRVAFDRHALREPYGLPELTVLTAIGRVSPPRLEIAQSAAPENLLRSSRGDENLAPMPPGTCRRSRQPAENLRSRNCRSADTQFAATGRKSNGPLQYVLRRSIGRSRLSRRVDDVRPDRNAQLSPRSRRPNHEKHWQQDDPGCVGTHPKHGEIPGPTRSVVTFCSVSRTARAVGSG